MENSKLREPSPALRQPVMVSTPYAEIATYPRVSQVPSGSDLPVLLLIHGNSCSAKTWAPIYNATSLQSSSLPGYNLLAIDLPNHGNSSNIFEDLGAVPPGGPKNMEEAYSVPGYAHVVKAVLVALHVKHVIVTGHSMGGHIAIEMIPKLKDAGIDLMGLCIVGSPPVPPGGLHLGFPAAKAAMEKAMLQHARGEIVTAPEESLMQKAQLSDQEVEYVVNLFTQGRSDWTQPFFAEDIKRAAGPQRPLMWKGRIHGHEYLSFASVDERGILENPGSGEDVTVTVINGKNDPLIFVDYFKTIKYKNLWKNKCWEIEDAYHFAFWESPAEFMKIWEEFILAVSAAGNRNL